MHLAVSGSIGGITKLYLVNSRIDWNCWNERVTAYVDEPDSFIDDLKDIGVGLPDVFDYLGAGSDEGDHFSFCRPRFVVAGGFHEFFCFSDYFLYIHNTLLE